MMKLCSIYRKMTTRGVFTIGLSFTLGSIYWSYQMYLSSYADRVAYNPNYNGLPGGEVLIPVALFFLTLWITGMKEENNFYKYEQGRK